MSIPIILSLLSLVGALYLLVPVLFIERWRGKRSLPSVIESGSSPTARVSVIFAARNEEKAVCSTLRRLADQDYPLLDIVVVNDRSEDETAAILEREEKQGEKITVVHIETLPSGWLGKCHALWKGVERIADEGSPDEREAKSDNHWLLFTDADVAFDRHAVRLAVEAAERHKADHLTLFPQLLWEGKLEASLLVLFSMMLGVGFRFWRVESRSMKAWVGIGAFNMIRRDLYERFNGHEALRLEVADDMKLGYLAKKYRGKSVAVYSGGMVRVRWREGARDVVRGIIRSGFAGINFNWWRTLYAVVGILLVFLLPFFLPFIVSSSAVIYLSVAAVILLFIALGLTARAQRIPVWAVLLYPVAAMLFLYGIFASALVATVRGGISWRDTFYSTEELRRGSVR